MVKVAFSFAVGVAVSSAYAQSFKFTEIVSDDPFAMSSVNDRGDVVGVLTHADGTKTGTVYNSATGFHNLGITDNDWIDGKLTQSGSVYSRLYSNFGQGPYYRTSLDGTRTQIDFTNGGAISFHGQMQAPLVSDDDRLVLNDDTDFYIWTPTTGTTYFAPKSGPGISNIFGFGNNGTLLANGPGKILRVYGDGTTSDITFPSGALAQGQTEIQYAETPSGSAVYEMLSLQNYGGGASSWFNRDYVVPSSGAAPYVVSREAYYASANASAVNSGEIILGLTDDGYAARRDADGYLTNLPSYSVLDRNNILDSGISVKGQSASMGWVIGRGTGSGLGTNVNIIGQYGMVPEPASFAILGLGTAALLVRRKTRRTANR
ncbi:MAG: PEP-CTERM sorting domain-containing protein [Armatimonadetes bacterium]|nr:PEP-CTERM sorting domain-containing protein [Armatimonadota bacterium]